MSKAKKSKKSDETVETVEEPKAKTAANKQELIDKIITKSNVANAKRGREPVVFRGTDLDIPGRIPSGLTSLDWLSGGGCPRGLYTCFWGPPGCFKTTLLLCMVAYFQKKDPNAVVMFLDGSKRFRSMIEYAVSLGVDLERFYPVETETVEEAVQVAVECAEAGAIDVVIADDLAIYSSVKELRKGGIEKDYRAITDEAVGTQALANGKFIRRTNGLFARKGVACLFTQQVRANMDPNSKQPYTMPGGHALKHALAFSVLCTGAPTGDAPTEGSKTEGKPIGRGLKLRVDKMALDRAQPEYTTIIMPWLTDPRYERGYSRSIDMFNVLNTNVNMIYAAGAHRKFNEQFIRLLKQQGLTDIPASFPGRLKCEEWLEENFDAVYKAVVPNVDLQLRDASQRLSYSAFCALQDAAKKKAQEAEEAELVPATVEEVSTNEPKEKAS